MVKTRRPSFWKVVFLIIGGMLLLILVLGGTAYGVFYFSAKKAWERTKGELLAKGEKLTLVELAPPPIPDAENFFGGPEWKELTDLVPSKNGLFQEPRIPKEQLQLEKLNQLLSKEEFEALKSKYPEVKWPPFQPTRWIAVRTWSLMPKDASPAQKEKTAEAVEEILKPMQPLFDEIRECAKRPGAEFPLRYEDGFSLAIPHVTVLLKWGQLLGVQGKVKIEEGNSAEAFEDVRLLFRVADTIQNEPLLICLLVRLSILQIAASCIVDGLTNHAWQDAQLAEFDRKLAVYDLLPEFILAMRGERGGFNQLVDRWLNHGGTIGDVVGIAEVEPGSTRPGMSFPLKCGGQPWLWKNQATYNRILQEWIEELNKAPTEGFETEEVVEKELQRLKAKRLTTALNLLVAITLPALESSKDRTVDAQTQIIQARTACALERYWLKNRQYPETLAQIVPEYLAVMPMDIIDVQPMRYRHLTPDRFLLYSIGKDRTDDHGLPVNNGKGDWVWGNFKRK